MNPEEFEDFKKRYGEDFASHADDILPIINEWRDWPWGRQPNFWATDAGKCERRLWLTMWGVPPSNPDLSDETTNNFAIGDNVEAHVVDKYRHLRGRMWTQAGGSFSLLGDEVFDATVLKALAMYGVVALEMFIPKVTYKMDIVFDDTNKQFSAEVCRYIVEVKSIKDWPFTSHSGKGEELPYFIGCDGAPSEDYYLQICQYLYYEKVRDGLLHFVNKNTGAEKLWYIDHDAAKNAVENVVIPKFRRLWKMYAFKELPERNHHVEISKDGKRINKSGSDWECRYCPQADRCWGLGDHKPLESIGQLREWLENDAKGDDAERVAGRKAEAGEARPARRRRGGKAPAHMAQQGGGGPDGVQEDA